MREIATSLGIVTAEGSAVSTAAENLRRMAVDLHGLDAPAAPPANGHAP